MAISVFSRCKSAKIFSTWWHFRLNLPVKFASISEFMLNILQNSFEVIYLMGDRVRGREKPLTKPNLNTPSPPFTQICSVSRRYSMATCHRKITVFVCTNPSGLWNMESETEHIRCAGVYFTVIACTNCKAPL